MSISRVAGVTVAAVLSTLAAGPQAYAADAWAPIAPLAATRTAHMAAAVGSHVYVMGGNPCEETASVEAFDTVLGTWSSRASLPTPRHDGAAVAVNGKIYVLGGAQCFGAKDTVEVYDPSTNTWSTRAAMPVPRFVHAAAAIGDKIYVVGGWDGNFSDVLQLHIYDTAGDSWAAETALPAPRTQLAAAALGGRLYAIGGTASGTDPDIVVFDPATHSWSAKTVLAPEGRYNQAAVVLNNSIYTLGGISRSPTASLARMDRYDAAADQWVPAPSMIEAREQFAAAVVNKTIYAVAGMSNFVALASAESFATASTDVTLSLSPNVIWPPNGKMVTIVPTLSVGSAVAVTGPVVTSNETPSAAGDWDTSGGVLRLRAARNGSGSGRVYTVTYTLTDAAGNSSELSATVTVPHDRGR
jgi:hypothetical protein